MQMKNLLEIQKKWQFPTALCPKQTPSQGIDYFILYGTAVNIENIEKFQQKCGQNFKLFSAWLVHENLVVLLQGQWQPQWIDYAHQLELDIAYLDFTPRLSQAGLLVMDMDSTAIEIECIDEIAKLAGTGELVSAITEQAMRGELDFEQSLRRRVATLQGASEHILQQVRESLPLMAGLQEMLAELKQYGWKTAIASGGFTYFADHLKTTLGLDFAVSNQFDIVDGILTGQVKGDIVDAQYKATTLQHLAQQLGIPLKHTIAIGDGANDLAMLKVAGLGLAYHAKPKVQQQAQIVVNFTNLTALLCILSANDRVFHLGE